MLRSVVCFLVYLTAFADLLGAMHRDFSATDAAANVWNPGNPNSPPDALHGQCALGCHYGFYNGADDPNGSFSTVGMSSQTVWWRGSQTGDGTPSQDVFQLHPSGSTLNAAVRRYTVGAANGEPSHSGEVRIVGRSYDLNSGDTNVFIAVDPDGPAGAAARSYPLPVSAADLPTPEPGIRQVRGARGMNLDVTATVAPGDLAAAKAAGVVSRRI